MRLNYRPEHPVAESKNKKIRRIMRSAKPVDGETLKDRIARLENAFEDLVKYLEDAR